MEKKKSSIGYIIVIILLILGFCGYILVDQGIIKIDMFNKKGEVEVEEKEELDVNSRLVQSLYNSVSLSDGNDISWYKFWFYSGSIQGSFELGDFISDEADELDKMKIVGLNLKSSSRKYNLCDISIPSILDDGRYSSCEENTTQYSYSRSYVESVYKSIFGKNAKLDTSVLIWMDVYGGSAYYYVKEYDAYFEYHASVGGTVGPGGYETSINKAYKVGSSLIIYEDVKLTSYKTDDLSKPTIEEFYNVYTFELEDDGMYKFVSRVKEDK